jgi:hypothetical protein
LEFWLEICSLEGSLIKWEEGTFYKIQGLEIFKNFFEKFIPQNPISHCRHHPIDIWRSCLVCQQLLAILHLPIYHSRCNWRNNGLLLRAGHGTYWN